jgi:two-component system chemotaxis response regulator CheY
MRALIVDDSNFIREYVRQLMERLGWTCVEAGDGSEALKLLRGELTPQRELFDLMLVDVNMPILNGLDCVKQLRDQRLSHAMKVMMVTTEADNSIIRRALDNGADEFLMKPFSAQSLREKLVLLGF